MQDNVDNENMVFDYIVQNLHLVSLGVCGW